MNKLKTPHIEFFIFKAMLFLGVLFISIHAFAFNSTQVNVFSAIVTVEGTPQGESPTGPIRILHDPISGVSLVTKQAIIQGVAGTTPTASALGTSNPTVKATNRKVRVTLQFRFIDANEQQGSATVQTATLPALIGDDPLPFAFQITPSSIAVGNLQYKIIAEKLNSRGIVEATSFYPKKTDPNVDAWVNVNIHSGNSASQVFNAQGGRFVLPDGNPNDGETSINIPSGVLRGESVVSIDEVATNSPDIPASSTLPNLVSVYRLNADPRFSGSARMTFLYPDYVFQYGTNGQDGIVDGTSFPEQTVQLYGWDGFAWRKLGGKADYNANTITVQSSFYSYFGIAAGATPITAVERRPLEKIITPNGDGVNDSVTFTLSDVTTKVDIFDSTGHKVRSLSTPSTTSWDGKDDSGQTVESGVYIYQYKVDGELVSGAIGVAK